MALKSKRNLLIKQKKSINKQNNRRSRRLNLRGGDGSVSLLYVNFNKNKKPEKYELILAADNIQDLILQSKDVDQNMVSSFKDEVINHMYFQIIKLDVPSDTMKFRKLEPTRKVTSKMISSKDESTLFYTYDCSGLVLAIYQNREDIERAFPEADIKSIKKNNFDWNHPLFS